MTLKRVVDPWRGADVEVNQDLHLIIGGDGKLGKALSAHLKARGMDYVATTRQRATDNGYLFDLLTGDVGKLPHADVVYLVAANASLVECEKFTSTYLTNVDAPIRIAAEMLKKQEDTFFVFISSEAAQWPSTAYGMHKRTAELGLLNVCSYDRLAIIRPNRITPDSIGKWCELIVSVGHNRRYGVHTWA